MSKAFLAGCLMALASTSAFCASADESLIWIEGEAATTKTVLPNAGLDAVDTNELSGQGWLSSFSHEGQAAGLAEYSVQVPAEGVFHLWVRGTGSSLAYRVDQGEWKPVNMQKAVQRLAIAADGSPFYPTIAWFPADDVQLAAGTRTITWRLGEAEGKDRYGAIDCFVLAAGTFTPNDQYKPGEQSTLIPAFKEGTTWAFQPTQDSFDATALLDLRDMNEKVAGEHGFVKLSADGNGFVRGDGQPLRFWASGDRTQPNPPMPELKRQARYLAKHGVNAVRIFAMLPAKNAGSQLSDVDEKELDCVFRVVAAMKEAGIYTILDGYWAGATPLQKGWDVTDPGRNECEELVYFDPKMQAGYRAWLKALCTRVNPYTNTKIADEPAVAVIQLQNEDSLIWWGIMGLKGDALTLLRQKYAQFLQEKYGSLEKALAAWQNYPATLPPDELAKGLPGFLHVWDFTGDAMKQKGKSPAFIARSSDQLEFFCRLMRQFNTETAAHLRNELGCKQLINANNWRTVDLTTTQDAQYWADSANDVIARNIYTGGVHFGVNNGWQILPGHLYSDLSLIKDPSKLPTSVRQPMGHPFILPEVLWCPPNLYQAEAPLMMAGQQSLTGLVAGCWFSNWVAEWDSSPATKWTYSTPMQIGQFPAAALIYRRGYLQPGEPAVVEHRSLTDLWQRKVPLTSEDPGFDPNRDQGNPSAAKGTTTAVDPLAYLVGAVRVVFDSDPSKTTVVDLSKYIDRSKKTVRSITGEIETDYGTGIYRINAPKAQAAAGFLKAGGAQKLADVEIACQNEYAAISVVSLDDRPIRDSGKLLVQIGTLSRPTGWVARPARVKQEGQWTDCLRIVSTGKAPWLIEKAGATLTVTNSKLTHATVLDANGMTTKEAVQVQSANGRTTLALPPDALYLILSAE